MALASNVAQSAQVDAIVASVIGLLVIIGVIYVSYVPTQQFILPGAIAMSILSGSLMIAAAMKLSRT
jgi:hypothetical protein